MTLDVHPGSGFFQSRIQDPGVKKAPDPKSGFATSAVIGFVRRLQLYV
jgi:hypothetical protein